MKLKSFKILSIILLIGIVTLSCNKENDGILQTQDVLKSNSVKHISIAELFQDKEFKQTIEKIPAKTKNSSLKDGETVMEHDYGFTIERFKAANVYETSDMISYTLLINRSNQTDNSIENLIINSKKSTNEVNAFIIKYESEIPITDLQNFNGNTVLTPIVYNSNLSNTSTTSKELMCLIVTYRYCVNHPNPYATGINCAAVDEYMTVCVEVGTGGASSDSYTSDAANTGVNTSGYSNTGGSGGTVQTSPVYQMSALDIARKDFTKNLSPEQRDWLEKNPQAALEIYAYLAYSNASTGELEYSDVKKNHIINVINFALQNTDLEYQIIKDWFLNRSQDNFWTYDNDGTTFTDSNPFLQPNFRFDPNDNYDILYPRFTNLAKNLKTFVKNNPKIMDALQSYSGFNKQQILEHLTFGNGPTIKVKELVGEYGHYDHSNKILEIRASYVRGLEQSNLESTQEATAFLLAVTILHEYVHFGTDHNNINEGIYDFGTGFEQDAFGVYIGKTSAGKIVIYFIKYF